MICAGHQISHKTPYKMETIMLLDDQILTLPT